MNHLTNSPNHIDMAKAPKSATVETRAFLEEALSFAVGETLQSISFGLGLLYLLFGFAHQYTLADPMRVPMSFTALGTAIILLGMSILFKRRPVSGPGAHAFAALIASFVLLNSLLHLFLSQDIYQSSNLILWVVGIGFYFLSTRWFLGFLIFVYVWWAWAMQQIGGDPDLWMHFTFGLISASLLGGLAHLARKRMLYRLTRLRQQDEARTLALQGALEAEQSTKAALRESEARYRQLFEQTQASLTEAQALYKVSQAVLAQERFANQLQTLVDSIAEALPADGVTLNLLDLQRRELTHYVVGGSRRDWGPTQPFADLWEGLTGWVVRELQPVLSSKTVVDERESDHIRQKRMAAGCGAIIVVPVQHRDEILGTLVAMNGQDQRDFVQRDVELLMAMAQQAALAIVNTRLYTELEQRALELHTANIQLAKAARLKDEFLASMSHELRTPLNAILGLTESLKETIYGPLNERQQGALVHIDQSGRHLLDLINDILDVAKIEAGKLTLDLGPTVVAAVCQSSLALIKQGADKKGVQILANLDEADLLILADDRRLKQILVNLLSNAVKFTAAGGTVGLDVKTNADEQTISLTVWDTGIGINPEEFDRLFKPFVQLDSRLAREYPGTGLGLTLVYRMTEMHGGSVILESEVGQGSRFTVLLPWRKPTLSSHAKTAAAPSAVVGQTAYQNGDGPFDPATDASLILVADDHPLSQTILSEFMEDKNVQLLLAQNGLEAIEQAKTHRPQLILMDMQMPEMDGLEAIRSLRTEMMLQTTPIIAMTALAMPPTRGRCLAVGATEVAHKPIGRETLAHLLEKFL